MPPVYELKQIECAGSPAALGAAQGEAAREEIQQFVGQRYDALAGYMAERGVDAMQRFVEVSAQALRIAADWDPEGTSEFRAIARASNVDEARLYGAGNMTDLRDVLLLPPSASDEGCSALLVPKERSQEETLYAGQTWDLNPGDIEYVLAVHRRPEAAPETWSITCAGCLSLIGMNAHGLSVGTTNIKTTGTRPGVGYQSLIHRALSETNAQAAAELVAAAPRAAAHTYWFADERGALELECDAQGLARRVLESSALVRTNHCDALRQREGEVPNASSLARRARIERYLSDNKLDVEGLFALFADRSDGIDSINRYLEDNTGTSTNACIVCVPARREFWACRGPADRGKRYRFEFIG